MSSFTFLTTSFTSTFLKNALNEKKMHQKISDFLTGSVKLFPNAIALQAICVHHNILAAVNKLTKVGS